MCGQDSSSGKTLGRPGFDPGCRRCRDFSSLLHVQTDMYVCMYIWGFKVRQYLGSLTSEMKAYWWLWWPNDIRGLCWPMAPWHLSYIWGKTPKKSHPGNLSRPDIEPRTAAWQTCMLLPAPQRWTSRLILGSNQPPMKWVTGAFPRGKGGRA